MADLLIRKPDVRQRHEATRWKFFTRVFPHSLILARGSHMALAPLRTTPSNNVHRHVIVRLPPANAYKEKGKCVVNGRISQRSRNNISTESGIIQEERLSHPIDRLGHM